VLKRGKGCMANFRGKFNNSIDPKGRASIPAKFREEIATVFGDNRLVLTEGIGGVACYPVAKWEETLAKIDAMPPTQEREDLYMTIVSPAVECTFDRQGRVQLSPYLREHAGLVGEVREFVAIGLNNKILLMNRNQHAIQSAEAQERLKQKPEVRYDLGL